MKFFNTAGPCDPRRHYMLPPEERLPGVMRLVEREQYFVVHAPRQSGKTTAIRTLAQQLTASGKYAALVFSCEAGRAAGEDYNAAQRAILVSLREWASVFLPEELRPPAFDITAEGGLIRSAFAQWAQVCPLPLVLLLDEIDGLAGQSLISMLSQIRDGYAARPASFPSSVVLCGMRDVRDYKAASGGDPTRLGSTSPFNILVKSFRLGDFTRDEVATLYGQHTADTGQPFTHTAIERAFYYSQGQPWLVNALAREVVDEMGIVPPTPITAEHFQTAKERLILSRATHLDSLAARLTEHRVRNIIEPLIAGDIPIFDEVYHDDLSYVRDLGLITGRNPIRIANPIYSEVIPRVLGDGIEASIAAEPKSFINPDGTLDFPRLLREFTDFWRQHGEILTRKHAYHEVAPQLVLMAFLQRIVNGGGFVDREYGLGYGRLDLLVRWPYVDGDGKRVEQREAIELKVWHPDGTDPAPGGLLQIDGYLDRLALPTGTLVIFDRRPTAPPMAERITFDQVQTPKGRDVVLLRA